MDNLLNRLDDILYQMYFNEIFLDYDRIKNNPEYKAECTKYEKMVKEFEASLSEKYKKSLASILDQFNLAMLEYNKEVYRQAYLMGIGNNANSIFLETKGILKHISMKQKHDNSVDELSGEFADIFYTYVLSIRNSQKGTEYKGVDENYKSLREKFEKSLSVEQQESFDQLNEVRKISQLIHMEKIVEQSVLVGAEIMREANSNKN